MADHEVQVDLTKPGQATARCSCGWLLQIFVDDAVSDAFEQRVTAHLEKYEPSAVASRRRPRL